MAGVPRICIGCPDKNRPSHQGEGLPIRWTGGWFSVDRPEGPTLRFFNAEESPQKAPVLPEGEKVDMYGLVYREDELLHH